MLIDCNDCCMQDTAACEDCVVSFVLHDADQPVAIDTHHAEVLEMLAEEGLVPGLRLIRRSASG
jgi:hypothetical protein